MKFEYNGNLLETDRINLVAKEIIHKYPQITIEKAQEAAMLEGKISSEKTIYDELNRLYNIMLVNRESEDIVILVYKDFLTLLMKKNMIEDNNYICLAEGINNYLKNYADFPFLSDFQ